MVGFRIKTHALEFSIGEGAKKTYEAALAGIQSNRRERPSGLFGSGSYLL